jgi:N utilization substance protein B
LVLAALCHLEDLPAEQRAAAWKTLLASPPTGEEVGETRFAELTGDRQARKFADALLTVVLEGWDTVDEDIRAASRRWRLERMDRVDRNALRIGAAELRHRPQTPRGVILSEVVRLASTYGNERSAGFVNGLSASLANALRPGESRS